MRVLHATALSAEPDLAAEFAYPSDVGDSRAWVRAVFVSSVDGAATVAGRAGGLGSDGDRRIFALQRALGDVVLVGSGTVAAEGYGPAEADEEWTHVRAGRTPTPPIAVVSKDLTLDPASALFADAPAYARTIVLTCELAPDDRRRALEEVADVVVVGEDSVDLSDAVEALAARGLRRITCEGGPTLMAQLVAAGRVDELCLTLSPMIVAGQSIRITNGHVLAAPQDLALSKVLEEDGFLFLLYRRRTD